MLWCWEHSEARLVGVWSSLGLMWSTVLVHAVHLGPGPAMGRVGLVGVQWPMALHR